MKCTRFTIELFGRIFGRDATAVYTALVHKRRGRNFADREGAIAKRQADASEYIVGVYLFHIYKIHDYQVHTKLLNNFYSTLLRV
jgi:hypothetical protein